MVHILLCILLLSTSKQHVVASQRSATVEHQTDTRMRSRHLVSERHASARPNTVVEHINATTIAAPRPRDDMSDDMFKCMYEMNPLEGMQQCGERIANATLRDKKRRVFDNVAFPGIIIDPTCEGGSGLGVDLILSGYWVRIGPQIVPAGPIYGTPPGAWWRLVLINNNDAKLKSIDVVPTKFAALVAVRIRYVLLYPYWRGLPGGGSLEVLDYGGEFGQMLYIGDFYDPLFDKPDRALANTPPNGLIITCTAREDEP